MDLPWNPAVLEQRISRAHRMGQKNPVQVFVLVTEDTIEENLLATLSAKHELALAALDAESDAETVDLASGMDELKRRLEILLGAKPEAPVDESQKAREAKEAERLAQRDKIALAGGQLLSAAFNLLGEMMPRQKETDESKQLADLVKRNLLDCMEKDDAGRVRLAVTLPDASMLDGMAQSLANVLGQRA